MNVAFTLPPMASLDHRDSFDTADDVRCSKILLSSLSPILTNRSSKFWKWLRMPHLQSLRSFRVSCSSNLINPRLHNWKHCDRVPLIGNCGTYEMVLRMRATDSAIVDAIRLILWFSVAHRIILGCRIESAPWWLCCADWWLRHERNGCACVPWFLQLLTELDSCYGVL